MALTPDDVCRIRAIIRDELRLALTDTANRSIIEGLVSDAVHERLERFAEHVAAIMRPVGDAFVRRCQQLDNMDGTLTDVQRGQAYIEKALLDDVDMDTE